MKTAINKDHLHNAASNGRTFVEGQKWRYFSSLIAVIFYILIYYVGPTVFLPTQANDTLTVEYVAERLDSMESGPGYYYTAFIYDRLSPLARDILVISIGLAFIYEAFRRIQTPLKAGVMLLLIIAPILLFLALFVKDTFIPPLTMLSLYFMRKGHWSAARRISAVCILYTIYGLIFRQYYLIIAFAFVSLYLLSQVKWPMRIVLILAGLVALYVVPVSVLQEIQGRRDIINETRVESNKDGSRTAFVNLREINGASDFYINYIYAALRLHIPLLFTGFGLREIYHMLFLAITSWVCVIGVRRKNIVVILSSMLFLAHLCVYLLFEPDLGSYLRHVGTVLLYSIPAFLVYEGKRDKQVTSLRKRKEVSRGRYERGARWGSRESPTADDLGRTHRFNFLPCPFKRND